MRLPSIPEDPLLPRSRRRELCDRWDALTWWPLLLVSVLFLIAYSVDVIVDPTGTVDTILQVSIWIVWGMFAIDVAVRLILAEHRLRWLVRHPIDLGMVIFPGLALLRLARFISVIAILQRHAGAILRGRIITYVVGATVLVTWIAAVAVLDVERDAPGASITGIGDSLWWAIETITTVGYGDYTPVTLPGRIIAVGLMLCGITLVGVITATFGSWLIEQVQDAVPASPSDRSVPQQQCSQCGCDAHPSSPSNR